MNTVINLDILDNENLKPYHINLFLHLIKLSENGEVTITISELMKHIRCKNRKQVIEYLRVLRDNKLIEFNSEVNKANTYKLNNKDFFK